MTFGTDHYVPVLKVKRGEKAALRAIAPHIRSNVTPLLEIVERKKENPPTIDVHLENAFRDLYAGVSLYNRYFLDARELAAEGPAAAAAVFQRAKDLNHPFTPVTGIGRKADVAAAFAYRSDGIAIRLTVSEFETGNLSENLEEYLVRYSLACAEVDLIVDLGAVDHMINEGVANLANEFVSELPNLEKWRTLSLSACAFPKSMAEVERYSSDLIERSEWKTWRDTLFANHKFLKRLPTFSDCGIQHPSGVEGFNPRTMHASPSVRYALDSEWLLIKGESPDRKPLVEQFPLLASELTRGKLREHYMGSKHCKGCRSMTAAANGAPKLGSPEVWRRLGTIHHITRTVEQILKLHVS